MDKTFMCDIITGYEDDDMGVEQILIKATTLSNAFDKLIDRRHYTEVHIYDQKSDGLFAHVKGLENPQLIIHLMIGEPTEIIE